MMDKLIHPTSKNIYLWGLVDAFCLFSFVLYGAFYISNSIVHVIFGVYTLIFLYSLFKAASGLIFNKFYDDGGILSITFIEVCFLVGLLLIDFR
ncbi:hypothetical protein OQI89_03085 [Lentilactobacillus diolivorans]|uniref:hypothetical protein n=1 Tax=Lentilactobacillus diolivorans TaxID=179838 RepID=UPI00246988BA|nr:hypothetical protein [Lentilactobacillus diolivorans]MDH5104833.1 hypothetical protein [Lentilactobacillus diolivorans]